MTHRSAGGQRHRSTLRYPEFMPSSQSLEDIHREGRIKRIWAWAFAWWLDLP